MERIVIHRRKKTLVCSPNEKKKAELLNSIDRLLNEGQFDQAILDLNYLLRTSSSRDQKIRYKLAQILFSRNDPTQALITLCPLLPSSNKEITELAIKSFLSQDEHKKSFLVLLNSPLNDQEKIFLYRKYFSALNQYQDSERLVSQIDIHCSLCGEILFYYQQKFYCLKCHSRMLTKFLA